MGNHPWVDYTDDQLEVNHPGCIWGIFHSLDYHQWHHNVKKILPHKKHDGGKRAKCNRSPKTRLNAYHSHEVQRLLDGEASHFLVNQSTTETSSTHKRSLKARIKALVSEENCKEEVHKRQGSGFPPRSRLQRTFSIHHLEPSDDSLDKISTKWSHPIIFLPKSVDSFQDLARLKNDDKQFAHNQKFDAFGTENVVNDLEHNKLYENHTISPEKCEKDYVGVLEIFRVNKEIFQKIIQNTDDGIGNHFHGPQSSKAKARLTKSGSFPVADSSHGRNFRPSKLKHKQSEFWSFRKGEELLAGTQATRVVASKFSKNFRTKSGPLMADETAECVLYQETRFSSSSSTQELGNQEGNEVVEPLKGHNPSAGQKESGELKESTMAGDGMNSSSSYHETDGSIHDISKATHAHFRRTSSLNESLEKYARLFEYTSSRKAKWNLSKSLKLTNEYEIPSSAHVLISFRRIRSLPHLDIFGSPQNEESNDSHFSGSAVDSSGTIETHCRDEENPLGCSISAEKCVHVDANEEIECLNSMIERSDISQRFECSVNFKVGASDEVTPNMDELGEEMGELTVGESNSQEELGQNSTNIAINKHRQPSPVSVLESCSQEVAKELQVSEDLEHICVDEDQLNRSSGDFLPESCSTMYPDNFENDKYDKENADFNYVKDILELSGFTENGFDATWHSPDQPLSPSVFEELEACWPHEPESSEDNTIGCCYHEHLFDLVNEILLQIYGRSFTYYPKALSSTCRIRPVSIGNRVLEEVWKSIIRPPSAGPELEQLLDSFVGQDFAKDDGWMNLQMESECVGLDLEDLIFDQLLEEIMGC